MRAALSFLGATVPLLKGRSNDIISENIRTLRNEGKSESQSAAIAYRLAGRTKKKANTVAKKVIKKPKDLPVKKGY